MHTLRLFAFIACLGLPLAAQTAESPPPTAREFRAAWVATVANIDWPSKPGLSTWDQQRELLTILDRSTALGLNAIIFQIRPGADAFYASPYEPWSQFLTGRQGRAPEPPWDPLAFAVEQAHKRGLELHAWFNPYRAAYVRDSTECADAHQRDEPGARSHIRSIPVDGSGRSRGASPLGARDRRRGEALRRRRRAHRRLLLSVSGERRRGQDASIFPTPRPMRAIARAAARSRKDDWRRDNVDKLVEALYKAVHAAKPWVKVGISPFGIWRPGNPAADQGIRLRTSRSTPTRRKWVRNGWADYFAPQLYWPIAPPQQSFPVLYDWWLSQNTKERHMWPGLADVSSRGDRSATHLGAGDRRRRSTRLRARGDGSGHVHYNMSALMKDPDSLDEKLALALRGSGTRAGVAVARKHAAVEADDRAPPGQGDQRVFVNARRPRKGAKVWLWTVRTLVDGEWTTEVLPGWLRGASTRREAGAGLCDGGQSNWNRERGR